MIFSVFKDNKKEELKSIMKELDSLLQCSHNITIQTFDSMSSFEIDLMYHFYELTKAQNRVKYVLIDPKKDEKLALILCALISYKIVQFWNGGMRKNLRIDHTYELEIENKVTTSALLHFSNWDFVNYLGEYMFILILKINSKSGFDNKFKNLADSNDEYDDEIEYGNFKIRTYSKTKDVETDITKSYLKTLPPLKKLKHKVDKVMWATFIDFVDYGVIESSKLKLNISTEDVIKHSDEIFEENEFIPTLLFSRNEKFVFSEKFTSPRCYIRFYSYPFIIECLNGFYILSNNHWSYNSALCTKKHEVKFNFMPNKDWVKKFNETDQKMYIDVVLLKKIIISKLSHYNICRSYEESAKEFRKKILDLELSLKSILKIKNNVSDKSPNKTNEVREFIKKITGELSILHEIEILITIYDTLIQSPEKNGFYCPYLLCFRGRFYYLSEISITTYKLLRSCLMVPRSIRSDYKVNMFDAYKLSCMQKIMEKNKYLNIIYAKLDNNPNNLIHLATLFRKLGVVIRQKTEKIIPYETILKGYIYYTNHVESNTDSPEVIQIIHIINKFLANYNDDMVNCIDRDSSASVYQNKGCIAKCKGEWDNFLNMNGLENYDPYIKIIQSFKNQYNDLTLEEFCDKYGISSLDKNWDKKNEFLEKYFTRKNLKNCLMTVNYGAKYLATEKRFFDNIGLTPQYLNKEVTVEKIVSNMFKMFFHYVANFETDIFEEKYVLVMLRYIAKKNEIDISPEYNERELLEKILKKECKYIEIYGDKTPFVYFKRDTKQIRLHTLRMPKKERKTNLDTSANDGEELRSSKDRKMLTGVTYGKEIDISKTLTAFTANSVHSVDGWIAKNILTSVKECKTVHDCVIYPFDRDGEVVECINKSYMKIRKNFNKSWKGKFRNHNTWF